MAKKIWKEEETKAKQTNEQLGTQAQCVIKKYTHTHTWKMYDVCVCVFVYAVESFNLSVG